MGAGAFLAHQKRTGNATHLLVLYQSIVILRFMRRTSGRDRSSAHIKLHEPQAPYMNLTAPSCLRSCA
jgi:hypothetical protein